MYILGIETSCDETSASVIKGEGKSVILKSNVTTTSMSLHRKTGGIIPENAAREQIKFILPVIEEALKIYSSSKGESPHREVLDFARTIKNIDAIALTYGPGLIGSLLVGVETAKTISFVHNIPLIPVNHMIGHIYANFICHPEQREGSLQIDSSTSSQNDKTAFPAIALVVSGGHTDLLLMKKHGKFKLLGGTRDDAAGEAFDKIARLLGLPYPGGPAIEEAAKRGNPKRFRFPRPMIGSTDFDFSFSGLKTAVLRETQKISSSSEHSESRSQFSTSSNNNNLDAQTVSDLALAAQAAIVDVLVRKTLKAAEKYNAKSILISGGVAANQKIRDELIVKCKLLNVKFFAPAKNLCTDNAAMIAAAGFYNYKPISWKEVIADPELYFV